VSQPKGESAFCNQSLPPCFYPIDTFTLPAQQGLTVQHIDAAPIWASTARNRCAAACFDQHIRVSWQLVHMSSPEFTVQRNVGLRVKDSIRKNFEDVSLDMVTLLLQVQQLFSNLME